MEDPIFWKTIHIILCAMFPALKALQYCDMSVPALDQILYLPHCADVAMEKSREQLNDEEVVQLLNSSSGADDKYEEIFGRNAVSWSH